MSAADESHHKIGELLVRDGLLPAESVQAALALQKSRPAYIPLGELLVEQKLLSRSDLQFILKKYKKRLTLGEILLTLGLVSHDRLHAAIELQKTDRRKLGKILVEMGFLGEATLIHTLSQQLGIPRMIPSPGLVDPAVLKGVSKAFLLRHECLPAFRDSDSVTVIMADPLSEETVRHLEAVLRCRVTPAIASPEEIRVGITRVFDDLRMVDGAAERGQRGAESGMELLVDNQGPLDKADENVSKFLNFLMARAIAERATDIHLEPMENLLRVRLRVDGLLQHTTDIPLSLGAKVTSRIKAVSRMDITESRRHQDGRLSIQANNRRYDLRVGSYSSFHGESLTIRILPNQSQMMDLDTLGLSPGQLRTFRRILAIPSGITMVAGPSGSGKSTTVYAALRHQNGMERKIVTVEDPVEYRIDGVMQSQVNEKAGLTYKSITKSILRQDPDVVMIGEIRDRASAESVIEIALSGHKVVTTFHTEDSVAALLRMFSIGVESFLITSTLMAVVGQRLVRTLCPECKVRRSPSDDLLAAFDSIIPVDPAGYAFHVPGGCPRCNHSGFRGRSAICEILVINDALREAILQREPYGRIRAVARATTGMVSIKEDGFFKATCGTTSLEEVIRVAPHHESDVQNARVPGEIIALCERGHTTY